MASYFRHNDPKKDIGSRYNHLDAIRKRNVQGGYQSPYGSKSVDRANQRRALSTSQNGGTTNSKLNQQEKSQHRLNAIKPASRQSEAPAVTSTQASQAPLKIDLSNRCSEKRPVSQSNPNSIKSKKQQQVIEVNNEGADENNITSFSGKKHNIHTTKSSMVISNKQSILVSEDSQNNYITPKPQPNRYKRRKERLQESQNIQAQKLLVEDLIRDQIMVSVYSSYIQVNFESEVNAQADQILENFVNKSIRNCIQELLSEMYQASLVTCLVDDILKPEVFKLAQTCISDEKQRIAKINESEKVNRLKSRSPVRQRSPAAAYSGIPLHQKKPLLDKNKQIQTQQQPVQSQFSSITKTPVKALEQPPIPASKPQPVNLNYGQRTQSATRSKSKGAATKQSPTGGISNKQQLNKKSSLLQPILNRPKSQQGFNNTFTNNSFTSALNNQKPTAPVEKSEEKLKPAQLAITKQEKPRKEQFQATKEMSQSRNSFNLLNESRSTAFQSKPDSANQTKTNTQRNQNNNINTYGQNNKKQTTQKPKQDKKKTAKQPQKPLIDGNAFACEIYECMVNRASLSAILLQVQEVMLTEQIQKDCVDNFTKELVTDTFYQSASDQVCDQVENKIVAGMVQNQTENLIEEQVCSGQVQTDYQSEFMFNFLKEIAKDSLNQVTLEKAAEERRIREEEQARARELEELRAAKKLEEQRAKELEEAQARIREREELRAAKELAEQRAKELAETKAKAEKLAEEAKIAKEEKVKAELLVKQAQKQNEKEKKMKKEDDIAELLCAMVIKATVTSMFDEDENSSKTSQTKFRADLSGLTTKSHEQKKKQELLHKINTKTKSGGAILSQSLRTSIETKKIKSEKAVAAISVEKRRLSTEMKNTKTEKASAEKNKRQRSAEKSNTKSNQKVKSTEKRSFSRTEKQQSVEKNKTSGKKQARNLSPPQKRSNLLSQQFKTKESSKSAQRISRLALNINRNSIVTQQSKSKSKSKERNQSLQELKKLQKEEQNKYEKEIKVQNSKKEKSHSPVKNDTMKLKYIKKRAAAPSAMAQSTTSQIIQENSETQTQIVQEKPNLISKEKQKIRSQSQCTALDQTIQSVVIQTEIKDTDIEPIIEKSVPKTSQSYKRQKSKYQAFLTTNQRSSNLKSNNAYSTFSKKAQPLTISHKSQSKTPTPQPSNARRIQDFSQYLETSKIKTNTQKVEQMIITQQEMIAQNNQQNNTEPMIPGQRKETQLTFDVVAVEQNSTSQFQTDDHHQDYTFNENNQSSSDMQRYLSKESAYKRKNVNTIELHRASIERKYKDNKSVHSANSSTKGTKKSKKDQKLSPEKEKQTAAAIVTSFVNQSTNSFSLNNQNDQEQQSIIQCKNQQEIIEEEKHRHSLERRRHKSKTNKMQRQIQEHLFKKIIRRTVRKMLFEVIQTSVDTVYYTEELVINKANEIIDSVVVQEINGLVLRESDKIDLALRVSCDILDGVIKTETGQIVKQVESNILSNQKKQQMELIEQEMQDVTISSLKASLFNRSVISPQHLKNHHHHPNHNTNNHHSITDHTKKHHIVNTNSCYDQRQLNDEQRSYATQHVSRFNRHIEGQQEVDQKMLGKYNSHQNSQKSLSPYSSKNELKNLILKNSSRKNNNTIESPTVVVRQQQHLNDENIKPKENRQSQSNFNSLIGVNGGQSSGYIPYKCKYYQQENRQPPILTNQDNKYQVSSQQLMKNHSSATEFLMTQSPVADELLSREDQEENEISATVDEDECGSVDSATNNTDAIREKLLSAPQCKFISRS